MRLEGLVAVQDPCIGSSERWTQKLEQSGVGAGYHVWPSAPHRIRGLPFVQGAPGVPLGVSNQGSAGAELHRNGPTVEKQGRDGKSVVFQGPRQGQWDLSGGSGCQSSKWGLELVPAGKRQLRDRPCGSTSASRHPG